MEQEISQIETEEQAGFRARRSTIYHVFSLKQLIEKEMSVDQTPHLFIICGFRENLWQCALEKLMESIRTLQY